MNRLGFSSDEIEKVAELLSKQQELTVRSVFSHLAAADDLSKDQFTLSQIESFNRDAFRLAQHLPYPLRKHILNSKGITRFTEHQYDMVRLGIGLFCPTSAFEEDIKNVNTLKTTILQIHNVKSGEYVGYGANNILQNDTRIAVIPIGYADGLNRKLGNGRGEVVVRGKRAKIIGTICMDTTMIEITGIEHVTEGDEVVIFGHEMPLHEVAQRLDTIPYEVLTSVSSRVKRVYLKE